MAEMTLTLRQLMIVGTYADGWQTKHVALAFGISDGTVKSTIREVKRKFASISRPVYTRIDILTRLQEDGWL
jgi:DNA-binding NarL/FixJ family response regulator